MKKASAPSFADMLDAVESELSREREESALLKLAATDRAKLSCAPSAPEDETDTLLSQLAANATPAAVQTVLAAEQKLTMAHLKRRCAMY